MDANEATKMVFARIQNLDLENVSKIMGYLLLQDYGEKEMIRLAFGPENLLHNLILQAKSQLGLPSSNTPPTPLSSPFNTPVSRPSPLSISSPRLINSSINGFESITNPSSPSTNSWPFLSPNSSSTPSYASVVNGANNDNTISTPLSPTVSLPNGFAYRFNNNHSTSKSTCTNDLIDDYQLQDHLSFLNDSKTDDLFDPRPELVISATAYAGDNGLQKRSFSVPGMCFGPEDVHSELGWKPCLYFSKGFCKNGTTCRFVHGGDSADGGAPMVGSPSKFNEFEQSQELLRSKAAAFQQQKLAEASMFGGDFSPYNKCMNFRHQQQNDTQRSATFMRGDEPYRFGRCRPERNDFWQLGLGGAMSPSSRQIYLTFPADSTFREEDVSNYFSIYGPVQDVRIPYQQKRMFGFVTFLYPETVKFILAKGNPHFVCDSRVLVKPYMEKGKIPDKKQLQQQQSEREEYSACPSPSGLNPRESFDHLHAGARTFCNTQEILLRRKLEEQAGLQQAIELQGRRLLNLQLLDVKNHNRYHQHQYLHGLSAGSPIHLPFLAHNPNNQTLIFPIDGIDQEVTKENGGNPVAPVPQNAVADADQEVNPACNSNNGNNRNNGKEEKSNNENSDLQGNLEHILPDNLFASPKKADGEQLTVFSTASVEVDENTPSPITSSSNSNPLVATSLNKTSLKSCFLQMPSLSSGHEAIGM